MWSKHRIASITTSVSAWVTVHGALLYYAYKHHKPPIYRTIYK